MEQLTDLQNTVHQYRKALEAFESRTGAPTQTIDARGSGEEREKIARIDADLDAAERLVQLRAAQKRIADLESRAERESRLPGGQSTDTAEYAQRWLKALVSGNPMEMRVLATGTSGAGIPTDMERRIVEKLQQSNVIRSMATVSTIDSKRTITVEGSLPTTNLVAEEGAITASDPSFGTAISVTPYKLVCATTMSMEFIEDAIGNGGIGSGLNYVADKIALSIGLKEEDLFTTGTNSSQPEGIAGSSANTKLVAASRVTDLTGAAITTVTGDNLIDTVHLVPPQYRNGPRFSWLISDTFLKVVRKIKVNTTDYVWKLNEVAGLSGGAPGTIYGVPYRIGQYVPTATANNNIFAVVGDFSYFEVFDRLGITSMVDPYSGAANQRTTLYVTKRTDSKIMLIDAFAAITC
jgi:HK97 family phage major capsid protein